MGRNFWLTVYDIAVKLVRHTPNTLDIVLKKILSHILHNYNYPSTTKAERQKLIFDNAQNVQKS